MEPTRNSKLDKEAATLLIKKKLKSPEKFDRTNSRSQTTKENKQNLKYSCKLCSRSFSQNSLLLKHELVHNGKPLCISSKDNAQTVTAICKFCNEQFENNDTYQMHVRLHLKKMNMIKRSVMSKKQRKNTKTTACNREPEGSPLNQTRRIKSPNSASKGGNVSHVDVERKINSCKTEKPPSPKGHKCHICNRVFKDMISCNKHTRLHLRVMPYKCNKCGVYCRMWGQFRNHVSTAHPDCTFSDALDLNHQVKSMAMETNPDEEHCETSDNESVFIDMNIDLNDSGKNDCAPHIGDSDDQDGTTITQVGVEITDKLLDNNAQNSTSFDAETAELPSEQKDADILNITDEILNNSGEMLNISEEVMKEFKSHSNKTSTTKTQDVNGEVQETGVQEIVNEGKQASITPPMLTVQELEESQVTATKSLVKNPNELPRSDAMLPVTTHVHDCYKLAPPLQHASDYDHSHEKSQANPSNLSTHDFEEKDYESNKIPPPVFVEDLCENESISFEEDDIINKEHGHNDDGDMLDNDFNTDYTSSVTLPSYQASETTDTTHQDDLILQDTPKYFNTQQKEVCILQSDPKHNTPEKEERVHPGLNYGKLNTKKDHMTGQQKTEEMFSSRNPTLQGNLKYFNTPDKEKRTHHGLNCGEFNRKGDHMTDQQNTEETFSCHVVDLINEDDYEEKFKYGDDSGDIGDDNDETEFDDTLVLLRSLNENCDLVSGIEHGLNQSKKRSTPDGVKQRDRDSNILVVRKRKDTPNSSILSPIIPKFPQSRVVSNIPTSSEVSRPIIKHSTPRDDAKLKSADRRIPHEERTNSKITNKLVTPTKSKPKSRLEAKQKTTSPDSLSAKLFHCHICGRTFNDLVIFRAHKQTHPDCLMHVCSECGWQFSSDEILQVHMEKHITGEQNLDSDKPHLDVSHNIVKQRLDKFYRSSSSSNVNPTSDIKNWPDDVLKELRKSGSSPNVKYSQNDVNDKHIKDVNSPQNVKNSQNVKSSQNEKYVNHSAQGEHEKYSEIVSSFLKDGKINAESILRVLQHRKEIFCCDACCMVFTDTKSYVSHRGLHDISSNFFCSACNQRFNNCEDYVSHFIVFHKL